MSVRETILAALHARLSALSATALRGDVPPERVPADGLLILRDGEPGESEVILSPMRYHYQHRAEIEAVVQVAARDTAFDTLTASIGSALALDRTIARFSGMRPVSTVNTSCCSPRSSSLAIMLTYSGLTPILSGSEIVLPDQQNLIPSPGK